jgi:hypothetical protein
MGFRQQTAALARNIHGWETLRLALIGYFRPNKSAFIAPANLARHVWRQSLPAKAVALHGVVNTASAG